MASTVVRFAKSRIESESFEKIVISFIILNSIILGLETIPNLSPDTLKILHTLDSVLLAFFTTEIILKIAIYGAKIFRSPWFVFDFIVVSIALLPASGTFSVLRALRVLRTLRMLSTIPSLKKVVSGLLSAIPGLGSVASILILIYYVGAVMATKLFATSFPEWFGDLGKSTYSLFQIMTLESWSMGIVRPVMEKYPYSWTFFIPFILITTFTMLNLFIAVIVNSMQSGPSSESHTPQESETSRILSELQQVQAQLKTLSEHIQPKK